MKNLCLVLALGLLGSPPVKATAQEEIAWQPAQAESLARWIERAPEEAIFLPVGEAAQIRTAIDGESPQTLDAVAMRAVLLLLQAYRGLCCGNERLTRWHIATPFAEEDIRSQIGAAIAADRLDAYIRSQRLKHPHYRALARAYARETDDEARAALARNLLRWRTLPLPPRGRYLIVNAAAQDVTLWDGSEQVDRWRVIVGTQRSPTPVFMAEVSGVVLNPWWNIPASIAAEGIGAFVRRDPAAARAKGYIRVGSRYRQMPGDNNALGRMKLVMPNRFSVFLHDTPARELFEREERTFSHGCVRVDRALDFAVSLLGGDRWSRSNIDEIVASNETRTVSLTENVPLFVAYFTAGPDDNGDIRRYPDIYGRDRLALRPGGARMLAVSYTQEPDREIIDPGCTLE